MADIVGIGSIVDFGGKILDKIIPDAAERDKAKLELLKAQNEGAFGELDRQLATILAEANSSDPWTSRARPSFLYVVYILILTSIPMGVLHAYSPETASAIATGFAAWLKAIPPDIIDLFQYVMLGYIGGRSFEKVRGVAK
jgi:hypothetical protein